MVQYHIGNKIKERRNELKLSQEQLALLAGVTPTYLGQVERGERNPTIGLLEKLAHALKIHMGYFFDCGETPNVSPAESRLLYILSDLSEEQKQVIVQLVDMVVDTMEKQSASSMTQK